MSSGNLKARIALILLLPVMALADSTWILWFGHSLMSSGGIGRTLEFNKWSAQKGLSFKMRMMNSGANYCGSVRVAWNEITVKDTLAAYNWDYVFYDKGDMPLEVIDTFYYYHRLWADTIRKSGAIPIIYDTWHHDIEDDVLKVCRDNNTHVAPIWFAYKWCIARYPDIHYKVDWAHAAEPLGYLAGCACWATAFAEKPFGFDKVYPGLSAEEAHLMQQAAWNACTHPTYLPFMPWTKVPALVKSVRFTRSPDTLEQFRVKQLLIRTVFTNDSVEASSKWAIFQSLNPDIISVSHSGVAVPKKLGTARVVAIREQQSDTLTVRIVPTTLVLDSVRIAPRVPAGYLSTGFQFTATGFFRDNATPLTMDITTSAAWRSSDTSIVTVREGRIQRVSGKGDSTLFVRIELNGRRDTVHFKMIPEFRFLTRINFQDSSRIFNTHWKPDSGFAYSDNLGYGWLDSRRFIRKINMQAILYRDSNFLRMSYLFPRDSAGSPCWGTFKLKASDGDYIVKIAVGSYYDTAHKSYVVFENKSLDSSAVFTDTLVRFVPSRTQKMKILKDTIRVFGEGGIKFRVFGPIAYLVVCSKEGVDIDSVSFDSDAFLKNSADTITTGDSGDPASPGKVSQFGLFASPNPFNPALEIRYALPQAGRVRLSLFDIQGRCIARLADSWKVAGNHRITWNAREGMALPASSGTYYLFLQAGPGHLRLPVVLLK